MVKAKIDEAEMLRMFNEGRTVSQIARRFKCTPSTVTDMKDRVLHRLANPPVVKENQEKIDVVNQLKSMNDHILSELKRCQRLVERADGASREKEKLEDDLQIDPDMAEERKKEIQQRIRDLGATNVQDILKIQSNIISISGEVRRQIELQVKIYETIFNVKMVAEFQEEIIEILRTVSPELKQEILKKLRQRKSVRGLIKME